MTSADRPLLGILLMLGFCVLAPLADATAKVLGERFPLFELVAARFVVQAAILVPLILVSGGSLVMRGRVLRLTALRTVLHITGIATMFAALRHLPLADAVAIAFVMPFIMLFLGWIVLGESIGLRRILASVAGFVGTLMVVQPSFAEVGPPALLPLGVAVVFALFMLVTRQIARDTEPVTLQAVSGIMASAVLVPAILLAHALHPEAELFVLPATPLDWGLMVFLGVLGTVAHLVMTWSLRFAPTATLAPMQYLEIPVATAIGWLVFRDFPDGLALAGIGVTMAAGIYIILRERGLSRSPAPPEPPAAPPAAE